MEPLTRKEREKKMREEEIIAAAEKIFCQKGFDESSMDEIATKAEFTKRTLYQYFTNKEDLYFAVALKGYKQLFSLLRQGAEKGDAGFIKLYNSCKGYYKFYKEFPEMMRLMNYIGHVKRRSEKDSLRRKELIEHNNEIFKWVAVLIEEGKKDGSICTEIDTAKTSFSLVFMITGFFSQVCANGSTFMEHFSLEPEEFICFNIDLLLKGIKR